MLIRLQVENWQSFRGPAEFSLVASRERQHRERLPRLARPDLTVLPVAAVCGANASGKSNLFRALAFARKLVVEGTATDAPTGVEPFRLGRDTAAQPTRFRFEILADDVVYEFGFVVDAKAVREEWLLEVMATTERLLYRRRDGRIEFGSAHANDAFLAFAFRGTRDNQLFLTNSVSQKVDHFKPVHDWFRDRLVFVSPDATFGRMDLFVGDDPARTRGMDLMLARLDTGIVHLKGESLHRVVTQHRHEDGSLTRFELAHESDGTIRIIDLLPAFLDLADPATARIYVIDELDRSLHTLLTRRLLEMFLSASGPDTRGQLLFTTHDALLMDQSLLRRDEMWVTERNDRGESTLMSFSEYKDVRYDKDIRKSYLQGRLGGVPRILMAGMYAADGPGEEEPS
ncbi:MAG: ATP-binding protein [bacterium]|nr:ATP-binding protein [bacterium]